MCAHLVAYGQSTKQLKKWERERKGREKKTLMRHPKKREGGKEGRKQGGKEGRRVDFMEGNDAAL